MVDERASKMVQETVGDASVSVQEKCVEQQFIIQNYLHFLHATYFKFQVLGCVWACRLSADAVMAQEVYPCCAIATWWYAALRALL